MPEEITIFCGGDSGIASLAAALVASIGYTGVDENIYKIYFMDCGITKLERDWILLTAAGFSNVRLEIIDMTRKMDAIREFHRDCRFPLACYSRIFIPEIAPKEKRALYLDCDVIARSDVAELFDQYLGGHTIGAIVDSTWKHIESFREQIKEMDFAADHKYFNSGVILIDCEKWRKDNITDRFFAIERQYRGKNLCPDQCLLNKIFENNYQELDMRFNFWLDRRDKTQDIGTEMAKRNDVVIRHYADRKPLAANPEDPDYQEFWFFARMTPFYEIMKPDPIEDANFKMSWKIFGFVPILRMRCESGVCTIKLFGFIPFIKHVCCGQNHQKVYIFGIPVMKIKRKAIRVRTP